jgi:hypothetical protein
MLYCDYGTAEKYPSDAVLGPVSMQFSAHSTRKTPKAKTYQ